MSQKRSVSRRRKIYEQGRKFQLDIRRPVECPNCKVVSMENHLVYLTVEDVVLGNTGTWTCKTPEAQ